MKHAKTILSAAAIAAAINLSLADPVHYRVPKGWTAGGAIGAHYRVGFDPKEGGASSPAVFIESTQNPEGQFASLAQTFDATPWRGKLLQFSVDTKLKGSAENVEIWINGEKVPPGTYPVANASWHSPAGEDWTTTKSTLQVQPEMTHIHLGIGIKQAGKVWIRNVRLQQVTDELDDSAKEAPAFLNGMVGPPAPAAVNLNFSE